MMTKMLATGAALAGLAFASAAFAEPLLEEDNIPHSSPTSPSTVNPAPDYRAQSTVTQDSTVRAEARAPVIYLNGEARTAVSTDVAAQLGIPIEIIASAPVPDTPANRARFGGPMSHAGKMTRPAGN